MSKDTGDAEEGLKIIRVGDSETIICPTRTSPFVDGGDILNGRGAAFLLLTAAPCAGIAGLIYGLVLKTFLIKPMLVVLLLNLVVATPTLWYWIQRVRLTIDSQELRVMCWPQFWSELTFDVSEIIQVYCTEERRVTGGGGSYSESESRRNPLPMSQTTRSYFYYEVHVISRDNEILTICRTVTLEQAKSIEQRIEQAFGLSHRPVPGEVRAR